MMDEFEKQVSENFPHIKAGDLLPRGIKRRPMAEFIHLGNHFLQALHDRAIFHFARIERSSGRLLFSTY